MAHASSIYFENLKIILIVVTFMSFIVLILMLDSNAKTDVSFRKTLIDKIKTLNVENIDDLIQESKGFKLKTETGEPLLLLHSLKKVFIEGYSAKDFLDMVSYFNFGDENNKNCMRYASLMNENNATKIWYKYYDQFRENHLSGKP